MCVWISDLEWRYGTYSFTKKRANLNFRLNAGLKYYFHLAVCILFIFTYLNCLKFSRSREIPPGGSFSRNTYNQSNNKMQALKRSNFADNLLKTNKQTCMGIFVYFYWLLLTMILLVPIWFLWSYEYLLTNVGSTGLNTWCWCNF